jgi:5'-3' exonuclease
MILVDAYMQLYRCNYKLQDLETSTGILTGMEFGFLKSLEALRRYFKDELILCWEGKDNFRYKIFSDYKANRRKKEEKDVHRALSFERIEEFKKFLSLIADNAYDDELEADDVMASLALRFSQKEKVVIYSGDKDMFQILQDKPFPIIQCRDYQHRDKPWTVSRIEKEFDGLTPQQLTQYFAIIGDKVDNIDGVDRIRKPIILSALREGYPPREIMNYELFSSKELFKLENYFKSGIYERNLKLVSLKIKNDIVVTKKNWDDKLIGEWLRKMQFRTLKLCQKCGIEQAINEDEEF